MLAQHTIESDKLIAEIIYGNKEIYVRNRQYYYLERLSHQKTELAHYYAENSFLPNIGKYVIEITVIVGAIFIAATQFLRQDASNAVAGLAIFLVAGTRLAPALLRLQQGFVSIKSHLGAAHPTLQALREVQEQPELDRRIEMIDRTHSGFSPAISISKLEFNYPDNENFKIWIDELSISPGEIVAIVGPSGSGKSTLLDLLLGILRPTSGVIEISGESPESAIGRWPGAIGYVPQEIYLSDKSLLENIGLGYSEPEIEMDSVKEAVENAQLKNFVEELVDGLATLAGDRGTRLSGGQKQRLGIARSLYTNPQLLILDEATSALDGVVEKEVSDAIGNLKSKMTIVLIAHRLSTVTIADRVIYMNAGRIVATGSFSEVRAKVPNFDKQAKLSGL
jgi:ABC-type multidrug transport system fused ATPase/permease subunit